MNEISQHSHCKQGFHTPAAPRSPHAVRLHDIPPPLADLRASVQDGAHKMMCNPMIQHAVQHCQSAGLKREIAAEVLGATTHAACSRLESHRNCDVSPTNIQTCKQTFTRVSIEVHSFASCLCQCLEDNFGKNPGIIRGTLEARGQCPPNHPDPIPPESLMGALEKNCKKQGGQETESMGDGLDTLCDLLDTLDQELSNGPNRAHCQNGDTSNPLEATLSLLNALNTLHQLSNAKGPQGDPYLDNLLITGLATPLQSNAMSSQDAMDAMRNLALQTALGNYMNQVFSLIAGEKDSTLAQDSSHNRSAGGNLINSGFTQSLYPDDSGNTRLPSNENNRAPLLNDLFNGANSQSIQASEDNFMAGLPSILTGDAAIANMEEIGQLSLELMEWNTEQQKDSMITDAAQKRQSNLGKKANAVTY